MDPGLRLLFWVGSSKDDLKEFPREVQRSIGRALLVAQQGGKDRHAKPLKGFDGAAVVEIISDHDSGTYRAVYTVRFIEAVYVLHAFQKKSRRGIETPRQEIEMIRRRLRSAEAHHSSPHGRN